MEVTKLCPWCGKSHSAEGADYETVSAQVNAMRDACRVEHNDVPFQSETLATRLGLPTFPDHSHAPDRRPET